MLKKVVEKFWFMKCSLIHQDVQSPKNVRKQTNMLYWFNSQKLRCEACHKLFWETVPKYFKPTFSGTCIVISVPFLWLGELQSIFSKFLLESEWSLARLLTDPYPTSYKKNLILSHQINIKYKTIIILLNYHIH